MSRYLLLLLLVGNIFSLLAQQTEPDESLYLEYEKSKQKYVSSQNKVVSSHAVGVFPGGLGYQYEKALSDKTSLLLNGGLGVSFTFSDEFSSVHFSLGGEAE